MDKPPDPRVTQGTRKGNFLMKCRLLRIFNFFLKCRILQFLGTHKIALISLKDKHFSLKISLLFIVSSDTEFELTLMT